MLEVPRHQGRHFPRMSDWATADLRTALDLADALKAARHAGDDSRLLPGRTLALILDEQLALVMR